MSEEARIWFVYLTDHHEGPFLPEEVIQKLQAGLITPDSLAWKDGMAEWQALETIPELASLIAAPTASAPVAASLEESNIGASSLPGDNAGGEEGLSLAQQLAASQSTAPAVSSFSNGGSVKLQSIAAREAPASDDPDENEEVWNLRNGPSVSGPYSFIKLKQLAQSGRLMESFSLWRPGLTDFASGDKYPELIQLRKNPVKENTSLSQIQQQITGGGGGLSSLIKKTGISTQAPRSGIQPSIATDDEPTDPGIFLPERKSFWSKLSGLFKKRSKTAIASQAAKKTATNKGKGLTAALKRVALYLILLGAISGGGGYYYLFILSPIPALEDVTPDALEQMRQTVLSDSEQGGKLFLALSQEDLFNPKFYVATNLPEGTVLTLQLDGVAGKLVNTVDFDTRITAPVLNSRLATFGPISVEGKPIPMGEYVITVSAEGSEKFERAIFLGGPKGPIYEKRMKQYQEKLQQAYDTEIQEMRELINTIKGLRDEFERKATEVGAIASQPPNAKAEAWKAFGANFMIVIGQLEQKLKPRTENPETFNASVYKELLAVAQKLGELHKQDSALYESNQPPQSLTFMPGLGSALASQEQAIAHAVAKSPLDALATRSLSASTIPAPTPPESPQVPKP